MPRTSRVPGFGSSPQPFVNTQTTNARQFSTPNLGPSPLAQMFASVAGTIRGIAEDKQRAEYYNKIKLDDAANEQYQTLLSQIRDKELEALEDPTKWDEVDSLMAEASNDPSLTAQYQNRFKADRLELQGRIQSTQERAERIRRDALVQQSKIAIANVEPLYTDDPGIMENLRSLDRGQRRTYLTNVLLKEFSDSLGEDVLSEMLKDPESQLLFVQSLNKIYGSYATQLEQERAAEEKATIKDSLVTLADTTITGNVPVEDYIAEAKLRDPSLTTQQVEDNLLDAFNVQLQSAMGGTGSNPEKRAEFDRLNRVAQGMPSHLAYKARTALATAGGVGGQLAASEVSRGLLDNLEGNYALDDSGVSRADRIWVNRLRSFGIEVPLVQGWETMAPPDGPEGEYFKEIVKAFTKQKTEAEKLMGAKVETDSNREAILTVTKGTNTSPDVVLKAAKASPYITITQTDPKNLMTEMSPFFKYLPPEDVNKLMVYINQAQVTGVDPNDPNFPARELGKIHGEVFKHEPGGSEAIADALEVALYTKTEWGPKMLSGILASIGTAESPGWEGVIAKASIGEAEKYAVKMMALEEAGTVALAPGVSEADRLDRYTREYNTINEFFEDPSSHVQRIKTKDYQKAIANYVGMDRDDLVMDDSTGFWLNAMVARVASTQPGLTPKEQVNKAVKFMNASGYFLQASPSGRVFHYYDPNMMVPSSYEGSQWTMNGWLGMPIEGQDLQNQLGYPLTNDAPVSVLRKYFEESKLAIPGIKDIFEDIQFSLGVTSTRDKAYIESGRGVPIYAEFVDDQGVWQRVPLKNRQGEPLLYRTANPLRSIPGRVINQKLLDNDIIAIPSPEVTPSVNPKEFKPTDNFDTLLFQ